MPSKDETTGFIENVLYLVAQSWVIMLLLPIAVPGFAPGFGRCTAGVFAVHTLLGTGIWARRGSENG